MHADLRVAIDAVAAALGHDGSSWTLRPEGANDQDFIDALYASTRWEELAPAPWPDEAKRSFLFEQARLQSDHYQRNYPGAALCIVEHAGRAVGRLYLYASPGEFRLMDIALVPERRGQGHGERMLRALMAVAAAQTRRITLHVEPNNPAQRLYARLGFGLDEDRGVYHFLAWSPPASTG
jgi:ribosomal protein S18 acetylase RimI-like enzyme